jgi:casein kinase II subunit beta
MVGWIEGLLQEGRGNLYVRIDDEFLRSSFNHYGVKEQVECFTSALHMIRFGNWPTEEGDENEWLSSKAEILYGVLHARYVVTKSGLCAVKDKFVARGFPPCPRLFCKGTITLPYGLSEQWSTSVVTLYCPCCSDLYNVTTDEHAMVDGACFGPSYIHMLLQRYPTLIPKDPPKVYVPRVFGFRILHPEDDEDWQ